MWPKFLGFNQRLTMNCWSLGSCFNQSCQCPKSSRAILSSQSSPFRHRSRRIAFAGRINGRETLEGHKLSLWQKEYPSLLGVGPSQQSWNGRYLTGHPTECRGHAQQASSRDQALWWIRLFQIQGLTGWHHTHLKSISLSGNLLWLATDVADWPVDLLVGYLLDFKQSST